MVTGMARSVAGRSGDVGPAGRTSGYRVGSRIGYGRTCVQDGRIFVSPAERTHRVRPDQERATRSRPFRGRRAARVVAQAAVLAVVAAATSAFAVLHKTVTVDVDGTSVEVEAFGRTVEDMLASARHRGR